MAVRITHTNNSSGHDGTYVYRSTSPMDPQNLPAPIADEPPVALGETFEYIDAPPDGTYYYRTQDREGGQVSAVSDEVSIQAGFTASVGDEVEGGIYVGTITYADAREFHIIVAKADSEASVSWGPGFTETGITDPDDGAANSAAALALGGGYPAFEHCDAYAGGGFADWYLGAQNEMSLVGAALYSTGHPEWTYGSFDYISASTEVNQNEFNGMYRSGTVIKRSKTTSYFVRPIRRVAV